jgi:subtilisin family serine protease
LGRDTFSGNDLDTFRAVTVADKAAKGGLIYMFRANNMMETTNVEFIQGFKEFLSMEERKLEAVDKPIPNYRKDIVGDNEDDINDKDYGNSDVMAGDPQHHGTHVSGIIAADRTNNKGIDGIADNVRIMMLRAVPDGDEHDKDIALAIRYAVDNGAKVITMSFGKGYSPRKKWIDEAAKYAESKNVLLVQAAGNDAKDIDSADNFPTPYLRDGTVANNWITVGASGDEKVGGLVASFSNYGKDRVDLFAPGVNIYSSVTGGHNYAKESGTSMASPVVAGTAAFLLEFFPNLTAEQLKEVIVKSAQAPAETVEKPGSEVQVKMSELCKSGGIINAYEAAKLASTMEPDQKSKKKRSPKSVLQNEQP